MPTKTTDPKATESELLDLLEARHAKPGNGGSGEYAFLRHVRNDAGFRASRTFDAMTLALWPSRGFELHVYEVKCSRSDWRRELADPAKSEAAWAIGDRFTIVATRGVVDLDELPAGWGLLEARGGRIEDGRVVGRKLVSVRPAEHHGDRKRQDLTRGLVVSMLRAAGTVAQATSPAERALEDARQAGVAEGRRTSAEALATERARYDELIADVRRFTHLANVTVVPNELTPRDDVDAIARRIAHALRDSNHEQRVRARLTLLREQLDRASTELGRILEAPSS